MICPVCGKQLNKVLNTYRCLNNHCFDVSKEGYVNLLLNSKHSGDNKEMIRSRSLFLNKGYFEKLRQETIEVIKTLNIKVLSRHTTSVRQSTIQPLICPFVTLKYQPTKQLKKQ